MNRVEKTTRDQAKKSSKSNVISIRIGEEEAESLNLISYEDDESISQIVRKAVKQYITLRNNKNAF